MGAINYGRNKYVMLGVVPIDSWAYEQDKEFMEMVNEEVKEYGGTIEEAINSYIQTDYECLYDEIEWLLSKYDFRYFIVKIEPGYYEGFYIDIQDNLDIYFDDYREKQDANKEITLIKEFLVGCARRGLVSYYPGWVTGYANLKQTLKDINEGIKEMRREVKETPTEFQYDRAYQLRGRTI